jgi:hypothetical protein
MEMGSNDADPGAQQHVVESLAYKELGSYISRTTSYSKLEETVVIFVWNFEIERHLIEADPR